MTIFGCFRQKDAGTQARFEKQLDFDVDESAYNSTDVRIM